MLNGRVRNGNGCGHPGLLTELLGYQQAAAGVLCTSLCLPPWGAEKRINAAKRSTVSTGQLRRLPALHTRPINLVVFQESLSRKGKETSSCRGFHA